jgi:hypothetical protein
MKKNPEEIYAQIQLINQSVRQKLNNRGLVAPAVNNDGTIRVGNYKIVKEPTGFYTVVDRFHRAMASNINLPQTAAVLANNLALGQWTDQNLITLDRRYGYALFDEEVHERSAKRSTQQKNWDRSELMWEKSRTARQRKESYREKILLSFNKLIKIA